MSLIMEQKQRVTKKKASQAGLAAFFAITHEWGMTNKEQIIILGNPEPESFSRWKSDKKGVLSQENKDRILQILRIYRALNTLYSKTNIKVWLRHINKNPLFNNRSPIEHMLTGRISAITDVKNYLDWVRE
ncbi:MAG: hypothetical protein ACC707_03770 [Thiohalomonadales bacterium]